jgi:hypothetical protein
MSDTDDDDVSVVDVIADEDVSVADLRTRDEYSDPYQNVDTDQLPDWWQEAIAEFKRHDLRPYQPPRFSDGALKQEVIEDLEAELGATVDIAGIDASYGDDWLIRIDREPIGEISYHRDPAGYTVYGMTSEEFAALVRSEA